MHVPHSPHQPIQAPHYSQSQALVQAKSQPVHPTHPSHVPIGEASMADCLAESTLEKSHHADIHSNLYAIAFFSVGFRF
jgi:hypothetical protein